MGEGLLPGGVFRQSAPGELEINIPPLLESPINKIIRKAYNGKHKGESTTRTIDDKLYPRGFTPPIDFITDENNLQGQAGFFGGSRYPDLPVEVGQQLNLDDATQISLGQRYLILQQAPLRFFDAPSVQFRHILEYNDTSRLRGNPNPITLGEDGNRPGVTYDFNRENYRLSTSNLGESQPAYMASFVKTHTDNEDPTLLGFDFYIRLSNSPLFNGTLEKFLEDYGGTNLEIENRKLLLKEFQQQFLKFFKTYEPNNINENLPSVGQFLTDETTVSSQPSGQITNKLLQDLDQNADMKSTYLGSGAKAYYVQSISGLGNLNETNEYGDGGKRFVSWGKDCLTITVNEDVSQNMGYLASIYKNLTWSRERGRLTVPENLLRFEAVLDITEVRKYTRIYNDELDSNITNGSGNTITGPVGAKATKNTWLEIADQTSKYRYFVHECQFFFPTMPHGDTLTTSPSEFAKGLDFKIYFKNSNLRFMKFLAPHKALVSDENYSQYHQRYRNNSLTNKDDYFAIKVVDNSEAFVPKDRAPEQSLKGGVGNQNGPKRTTVFSDGTLKPSSRNTAPIGYPVEKFLDIRSLRVDNFNDGTQLSDEQRRRLINQQSSFFDKIKVGAKNAFKSLGRQLLNRGVSLVNNQIINFASLVNRTLNQILNSTPVVGGIKPPKNLYEKPNEFEQAYIDFVGPGLRTFFQDPMKFRKEGRPGETLGERIARTRLEIPTIGLPNSNIAQIPSLGNRAESGVNLPLKQIVENDPSLGLAGSNIPTDPALGNNADIGVNKTLQQIVDSDPNLGIPNSNIPTNPALGNNADMGLNRTLQQIVDSDPDLGIPNSNIPTNPSQGNNAEIGDNLTLEQIVASNPSFGIPGSLISSEPALGNNAEPGLNSTLQDIVNSDPEWGIEENTTDPSIGNSAKPSTNLTLDQIVSDNPEWGIQNSTKDPSIGNNAQLGTNLTLQEIVNSDPKWGIQENTTDPSIGNNANQGPNSTLQQIVDSDPEWGLQENTTDPSIGNNAEVGRNSTLQEIVDKDPSLGIPGTNIPTDPALGNNAQTGRNSTLQEIVDSDPEIGEVGGISEIPSLGNSALPVRKNPTLQEIVNSDPEIGEVGGISEIPSLGNSATRGPNKTLTEIVNSDLEIGNVGGISEIPSLGNNATVGTSKPTDFIVDLSSVVINPELGNGSDTGTNVSNQEVVNLNTMVINPNLGNSGASTDNNPTTREVVINQTTVIDPSEGNSALESSNFTLNRIVDSNSKLENESEGNSAKVSANTSLGETVFNNTELVDVELGNSSDMGDNLSNDNQVIKKSQIKNPFEGNSALLGNNISNSEVIKSETNLSMPELANNARMGSNLNLDEVVSKKTTVVNQSEGNSGRPTTSKRDVERLVSDRSTIERPSNGNSGFDSPNKKINDVLDNGSGINSGNIGNNGLQSSNSQINDVIKRNSQLNNQFVGNGSIQGQNTTIQDVVNSNSEFKWSPYANQATQGSNTKLDEIVGGNSEISSIPQGNSKNNFLNDTVKENTTLINQTQDNGGSRKLNEVVNEKSGLSEPGISNGGLSGKNVNLDELMKYSYSRLAGKVDWNDIRFPKSNDKK